MIRLAKSLPKPIRRPIKVEPVLPVKEDEQIALLRSIDEKLTPKPEEPEEEEVEEVKITEPIEVNVLNFPVPPEPKECKHEMKECVHKEVTVNVPDEVVVKDLPLAQGASTSELQKKTIEALKKVEEIVKKLNFTDDGELKTTGKGGGNDGFYGVATGANQLAEMQILNSIVDGLSAVLDVEVTNTVTVQAANLDIRDLTFATDKVDVTGSSITTTGSVISDSPEYFEDTNFVTGDSPVTLDFNTALGRNATSVTIWNDGFGDFTYAISNDGASFGDEIRITRADGSHVITGISIDSIRITWVSNSAYRVTAI